MKVLKFFRQEKSIALLAVILFLLLVVLFQAAVLKYTDNQSKLVIKNIKSEETLYKSDAGVQYAKYLVQKEDFDSNTESQVVYDGNIPSEYSDNYDKVNVKIYHVCEGKGCTKVGLTSGPYNVTETYTATIDTTLETPSGSDTTRSIEVVFKKYWRVEKKCPPDTAKVCEWHVINPYGNEHNMFIDSWEEK